MGVTLSNVHTPGVHVSTQRHSDEKQFSEAFIDVEPFGGGVDLRLIRVQVNPIQDHESAMNNEPSFLLWSTCCRAADGLNPARQASRVYPARALRYK
jgi:hypothetical protein